MKKFLKRFVILMIAFLFSVAYLPPETKAYTPKEAKYNKYKNKSAVATKKIVVHDVKGNSKARSTKAGIYIY